MTFKALNNQAFHYKKGLLTPHRLLCSFTSGDIALRARLRIKGYWTFAVRVPNLWNNSPAEIRSKAISPFRSILETFFF